MYTHFTLDSQANVSGNPPTPFSRANSTAVSSPSWCGTENVSYVQEEPGTANWTDQGEKDEGMRIDSLGEDEELSALLKTPPGPRTMPSRGTRNGLCRALEDPPSRMRKDVHSEERSAFRDGYAPRQWDSETLGRNGKRRMPAVEDWGEDGDASEDEFMFSPIPNTKAWEYRRDLRRDQTRRAEEDEDELEVPRLSVRGGELPVRAHTPRPSARSHAETATRSEPSRDANPAFDNRNQNYVEGWRDETSGDMQVDGREDWRDFEMIPSAVAQGPHDEDAPALAENPRERRWEVYFDDPERLVSGQSVAWQREMWKDQTVVIFTAYNYRYTTNGVVNRHVESAVTAMTTAITGESNFNVVPPDPDQQRILNPRDLPFTWGIRGLSAAGAARMTAVRVASSRGVSIITYPRRLGNPKWICSLVGFLRPDADVIRAAVMDALQTTRMREWLDRMTNTSRSLRKVPRGERVQLVLNSLEVRIADLDDGDFMANIYMDPPTDDMAEWREWVSELRAHRYNNFLNGSGVARRIYWCAGCRGVDHDTMKCQFPTMRGWQGTGVGGKSHTAEQLGGSKRGAPLGGRGGGPRGGGTWKGRQKEAIKERNTAGNGYAGEGWESVRRGAEVAALATASIFEMDGDVDGGLARVGEPASTTPEEETVTTGARK
ncbi:hypothetical protein C8T65DRAFT_737251 [Cerioporus squamosus]|nr:hypothetical protein C8T65DRAFT_737251 [Cerioporus squamosus]